MSSKLPFPQTVKNIPPLPGTKIGVRQKTEVSRIPVTLGFSYWLAADTNRMVDFYQDRYQDRDNRLLFMSTLEGYSDVDTDWLDDFEFKKNSNSYVIIDHNRKTIPLYLEYKEIGNNTVTIEFSGLIPREGDVWSLLSVVIVDLLKTYDAVLPPDSSPHFDYCCQRYTKENIRNVLIHKGIFEMRIDELTESPKRLNNYIFDLSDPATQAKVVSDFKHHKSTYNSTILGVKIYYYIDSEQNVRFVGFYDEKAVLYSEIQNTKWGPSQLRIGKVNNPNFNSLMGKFAIDVLVDGYGTLVSDSGHTTDGERFWKSLMGWVAQNTQLNIDYVEGNNTDRYDRSTDIKQWINSKDAWGNTDNYKNKRFVISK